MRDVLGLQIGDGTAQIMKPIIAREAPCARRRGLNNEAPRERRREGETMSNDLGVKARRGLMIAAGSWRDETLATTSAATSPVSATRSRDRDPCRWGDETH